MTERENLAEKLTDIIANMPNSVDCIVAEAEYITDYLLANGVIVPPCKVGDKVYIFNNTIWMDECGECQHFQVGGFGDPHECARTKSPFKHNDCIEIEEVVATQRSICLWLAYGDFGKTVFLTREEAERALKGGERE